MAQPEEDLLSRIRDDRWPFLNPNKRKGKGNMKDYSTILEAIEEKLESIQPGSAVRLSEIIGDHKEKEIIAAAKMLIRKYGLQQKGW